MNTPILWTKYSAEMLDKILQNREYKIEKTTKKIEYKRVIITFDIETSSFYLQGQKCAIMYCWQSMIDDVFIMGRTYDDFLDYMEVLHEFFSTDKNSRVIVWVHNFSYEFQFIRKHLKWKKVFAIDARTPVYAITESGIEFRCSYILSGYSLANLARQQGQEKKIGDLDYSKIRTPATPLTEKEVGYCYWDVKIVADFIKKEIEQNKGLSRIPLTKTGYVRKFCKRSCYYEKNNVKKYKLYRSLMENLVINDETEYKMLKRAFQGGFTHANCFAVGKTYENVSSYDLTSSYPAVMLSEKFPMSRGVYYRPQSKADFLEQLKKYCCVFDIKFYDLQPKIWWEHPLSRSRCFRVENAVVDNGRVVTADSIATTITNVDFQILTAFYTFSKFQIGKMIVYRKGYLPHNFIKAILKLYSDKTTLKGVEGKEVEYSKSKEMINSAYGMTVTDIVRENYLYNDSDEWETKTDTDIIAQLEKYNKSKNRFLFYPWGVFVTAYARRNLFSAIISCGSDYLYSDTDSVKILNRDAHKEFFIKYNDNITRKVKRCLTACRLDISQASPKTIEGKPKPIGVWDFEGEYDRFKTLGAKRYLVEDSGKLKITVAGLAKAPAVEFIEKSCGDNPFDFFKIGLHVPPDSTGKNTHTYIDEPIEGYITDYQGRGYHFKELSCVHLEGASYDMSISSEFENFLLNMHKYKY